MKEDYIFDIPVQSISDNDNIVIYGAGKIGKQVASSIKYSGNGRIVAFIDKNAKSICPFINDIPLFGVSEIKKYKNCKFVIAIEDKKNAAKAENTILSYGVKKESIVRGELRNILSDNFAPEIVKFTARALKSSLKRIFIFMLPEHGNTGDYLIGYSEMLFFGTYFSDYSVYGITTLEWLSLKEFIKKLVFPQDVICINGGGFFGDLRGDDVVYKDIIESFPENPKFFMPNTLSYKESVADRNKNLQDDIDWIKTQKELFMFFRDYRSYQTMSRYIDNCGLAPDMALFWKEGERNLSTWSPKDKVLLCLRNDCEKRFRYGAQIEKLLLDHSIKFESFDIYINQYVSQDDGRDLVDYVFKKFREFNCVITDRLHAMIISTIASIPCIAFDNSTKKISGVYKWIQKYKYIRVLKESDATNILEYLSEVTDIGSVEEYTPLYEEFENMAHIMANIID